MENGEFNLKFKIGKRMNVNARRASTGMDEAPQDNCDMGAEKMMGPRPDYINENGQVDLHRTTDGMVWAREFVHILGNHPTADPYDVGFMHTWFANAIETGRMEGRDAEMRRDFVDKLHEIIFQAAGAATMPLLMDHPDYVFPSERVTEAVNKVLATFGIPSRPIDA